MSHSTLKVILTGVCGRLGRRVARHLHRFCEVVGVDERPFEGKPKDLEHHRMALTRHRIRELFSTGDDQALIHLGIFPPTIFGFDPMVQVVHDEDVAQAIVAALKPGVRGTFNLGGPPAVPLSQALKLLGRASVSLPHGSAKLTLDGLFKAKMSSFRAPELNFIRYVCMVHDSLARGQLVTRPASRPASRYQKRWLRLMRNAG